MLAPRVFCMKQEEAGVQKQAHPGTLCNCCGVGEEVCARKFYQIPGSDSIQGGDEVV